ncbi:MAG: hypothetical protein L0228_17865 [Planctomycetes bacterium]|nr:hypothetical protein [Planctomycetota bacterium]
MARKAISNDRYRLVGTYERLRKSLVERPDDGRLDKALSYWVLPTDRRLPIAFLDRPLRDLLSQPLDELMATPGVGQKKIIGFFDLLKRASKATSPDAPFGLSHDAKKQRPAPAASGFDASIVSESLWAQWCETVNRYGMGPEKLGRLAPTLQALPTVIWHSRLEEYADRSLADIRSLKTHGEKRVNAILEVFCTVHEALATATLQENVDVVIMPRFVPPLTRWLLETVGQPDLPPVDDLHQHIVKPMINQIKIDLGDQVAGLAAARLCLDENSPSVKQQAQTIGVTRARVYQLLEDCAKVMDVRWPEGRWLFAPLATRFGSSDPETIGLVHGIVDLFFPPQRDSSTVSEESRGDLAVR